MTESLVRYDPPLDLGSTDLKTVPESAKLDHLPAVDERPTAEDVLHAVLPARKFIQNGHLYEQHVSNEPSTRQDVMELEQAFNQKLQDLHARDSGLCPIRDEVYSELLDELIRQITINQPERGLMLLRLRDEAKMSILSYQTLYESSIVFASRKQLQSEEGLPEEQAEQQTLESDIHQLKAEVAMWKQKVESAEAKEQEKRDILAKKRAEEIIFLKQQGNNMDHFLKSLEKAQAQESQQ